MSPKEAIARIEELRHETDLKSVHNGADAVLLEFLMELGYEDVVTAFAEQVYCRATRPSQVH